MSLFATKPLGRILAESEDREHSLKRTLGPVQLVALGIGAIIGAGLFSLTGIAAAENAGPAVVLSFVVAAIGCAFAGMCYSEFATMIPIAGSAYTYAYATMGELLAWIIGWDLVLEYAVGAATVSVSWSSYVVKLFHSFGVELPVSLTACPFDPVPGIINLPAVFIILIMSTLLIVGIQESARVNSLIVVVKVTIVIIVIAVGFSYINPANYHPFIPENTGKFGEFGLSGVMRAAAVVFFAFIGFDAVSTAAQEARRPQRDMPIGIIGSLIICTVLYVLFARVLTGMVNYQIF
jgi:APA family basic amino acid/polyamine antiporter